jgi:hypothetical protein
MVVDPTVFWQDKSLLSWSLAIGIASSFPFCSSLQQANTAIIIAPTKRPVYTCKNLQLVQVNLIKCFTFPPLYMLLSHRDVYFVMWSKSLVWNAFEMCHLSLRLVVVNLGVAMNTGCSKQSFYCIESVWRIPFIWLCPFTIWVRIGIQSYCN